MNFNTCTCVTIFAMFAVILGVFQAEGSRDHHEKPLTYGSISDDFESNYRESQRFMRHQRKKHKKRGHHGREEESSSEISEERRHRSKENSVSTSSKSTKGFPQHFKDFIENRGCGDSPVYKKFLSYYKQAMYILQQRQPGTHTNDTWLLQLANSKDTCDNSCDKKRPKTTEKPAQPAELRKISSTPTPTTPNLSVALTPKPTKIEGRSLRKSSFLQLQKIPPNFTQIEAGTTSKPTKNKMQMQIEPQEALVEPFQKMATPISNHSETNGHSKSSQGSKKSGGNNVPHPVPKKEGPYIHSLRGRTMKNNAAEHLNLGTEMHSSTSAPTETKQGNRNRNNYNHERKFVPRSLTPIRD